MRKHINIHWFLVFSLLLVFFDYLAVLNFIKSPMETYIVIVKRTLYLSTIRIIDTSNALYQYPKLMKLKDNYESIRKQNQELLVMLELLEEENKELRRQLEAPLPASYKFIPAQVIAVSRYMDLAVGEGQKVLQDMVVVDGNILIGKIIEVSKSRSKVMLLTDPDSQIKVRTSRGTQGKVVGRLSESMDMIEVLQKDSLFLGDLVVTSGEGGFPPNLIIGKIDHITVSDVSPYKQAKVVPLINIQTKKFVFIINEII